MNRLIENIGTCYKSRPPQNRHISPRLGEKGFRFPPHGAIPEVISKIKHIAFLESMLLAFLRLTSKA